MLTTAIQKKHSPILTRDGTRLYYKDWGIGRPVVFSHGWPLTADAWDSQMLFLSERGYRVIAHDRRGHGRSDQTWPGNDMDTYADDLGALIDALDLKDAVLIGHSTGGGEVARYIGRHGTSRVAKAVLISSVPPTMLRTAVNPDGTPMAVFDQLRAGIVNNRSQFYRELALPFYNYNLPGATVSQGIVESFWMQGMQGGIRGHFECIKQFSETDFSQDLRQFGIPTLVLHGDGDQIVPIADASLKTADIIKRATLKVYSGAPHGLCTTLAEEVNSDILSFLEK